VFRQLATAGLRRLAVVFLAVEMGLFVELAFFELAFFLGVAGGVVVAANRNAPANRTVRISIQTFFFNSDSRTQARMPVLQIYWFGTVPARNELTHLDGAAAVWPRRAPVAACMIWKTTGSPGFSEDQMRVTSSALITG